jgi:hypothetical protein
MFQSIGVKTMSPRYAVRLSQAVSALVIACRDGGEFTEESLKVANRFAVLQNDLEARFDIEYDSYLATLND